MKFLILSDLHLESIPYPECFRPAVTDYDVLVAAGDIWESETKRAFAFLRKLAKDRPIVAVLGNHEHWRKKVGANTKAAKTHAKKFGVTLLDGEEAQIDDCRFFGCTLWSDYRLTGPLDRTSGTGEEILTDRRFGSKYFTIQDSIDLHRRDLGLLEKFVSLDHGKNPLVVVTHHAPHPACLPRAVLGKWRAGNAASDLSHLTDTGRVALWVHGHTHHCIDLTRPGGTRIVSNAAGPGLANPSFDENLVVELGG